MGDNIRVGHPWAGIRFDAGLLKRPMATADAMIESLMRHYGDLRLAALPGDDIEQLRRQIARLLRMSEGAVSSVLSMLAQELKNSVSRFRVAAAP